MKSTIVFLFVGILCLCSCQPVPMEDESSSSTAIVLSTPSTTALVVEATGEPAQKTEIPICSIVPAVSPIPDVTVANYIGRRFTISELPMITDKHVDEIFSNSLVTVVIDADVVIPTASRCPIISCKRYDFDYSQILKVYFGNNIDSLEKKIYPDKPVNNEQYYWGEQCVGFASLPCFWVWYYQVRIDRNSLPDMHYSYEEINSGICTDEMHFSQSEAISMAIQEINKATLPFDTDHPVIHAYKSNCSEWPCYYEISFMRYYDGIPVYPGSFNRGGVDGLGIAGETAKVTIYPQGVYMVEAVVYEKAENIVDDAQLMSLQEALGLLEENLSLIDQRIFFLSDTLTIREIALQYVQWATQDYYADNSYQPCWVFTYEGMDKMEHSLRINAYDGTLELGDG